MVRSELGPGGRQVRRRAAAAADSAADAQTETIQRRAPRRPAKATVHGVWMRLVGRVNGAGRILPGLRPLSAPADVVVVAVHLTRLDERLRPTKQESNGNGEDIDTFTRSGELTLSFSRSMSAFRCTSLFSTAYTAPFWKMSLSPMRDEVRRDGTRGDEPQPNVAYLEDFCKMVLLAVHRSRQRVSLSSTASMSSRRTSRAVTHDTVKTWPI